MASPLMAFFVALVILISGIVPSIAVVNSLVSASLDNSEGFNAMAPDPPSLFLAMQFPADDGVTPKHHHVRQPKPFGHELRMIKKEFLDRRSGRDRSKYPEAIRFPSSLRGRR